MTNPCDEIARGESDEPSNLSRQMEMAAPRGMVLAPILRCSRPAGIVFFGSVQEIRCSADWPSANQCDYGGQTEIRSLSIRWLSLQLL